MAQIRRISASALSVIFTLSLITVVNAQHDHGGATNGLDPTMDMPMNLAMGNMISYLHVTPGDILWFQGWVPGRNSTLFGACVGLFVLGLLERWIAALRAALEVSIYEGNSSKTPPDNAKKISLIEYILLRGAAPFVLRHAISRGMLHMFQVSIGFLFMLAVMTFQVAFILSAAIGLAAGEMMYGRYTDAANVALHGH
ncbi:CTR copper uptake transporter [Collybia nuda]|uniref:Copper transport protein n=1 Tax=Collybia nuda TaxID=64659 RepID=A0A9P5YEY4_9AGAR|nr:CTR copper uptake transporter [Collybia nuda]